MLSIALRKKKAIKTDITFGSFKLNGLVQHWLDKCFQTNMER